MDAQLEDLIAKIKEEGVDRAKQEADQILKRAEKQAEDLLEKSNKDAEKVINDAKISADKFQKNSQISVNQAARDTVLNVKEELTRIADKIFKQQIAEALTPEFLKELIKGVVDKWTKNQKQDLQILVSEKDKAKLKEMIAPLLKKEAKNGIDIKAADLDKGFKIKTEGEEVVYDFSDESILEALKEFLNPALQDILSTNE
ncbi:MAG: hypothetical protein GY858_06800 [Candidatus Omnitrophica bacterium]|nr:hypothetical protein [Candidatus Omnitrophota bacterium]